MTQEQKPNFENNLEKLEQIVKELESGELSLEQCLDKFEQGVELYKGCKGQLSKAEKRIARLTEDLEEEEIEENNNEEN